MKNRIRISPPRQLILIALAALFASLFTLLRQEPAAAQSSRAVATGGTELGHVSLVRHSHSRRKKRHNARKYKKKKRLRKAKKKKAPFTAKWYPKDASKEPVQIVVSLPEQRLTLYQGSKALVTSKVSSGKLGYSTPAGVFSILGKRVFHRSNIYSNAPMPYMQRLTWSGIALHESKDVPDHPASHGCVRLPNGFARELFGFTEKGIHVVIANEKAEPTEIRHDNLFQPSWPAPKDHDQVAAEYAMQKAGIKFKTVKRPELPLRMLVTRRTGRERLIEIQTLLNRLAFDAGEVDGWMGSATASAIRRFQKTYGLKPNGLVSDDFIEKLFEVAGEGKPKNGHLYVRRNFEPLFDIPVLIREGNRPLGSHLFTAQHFERGADETRWLAVTLTKGTGFFRGDPDEIPRVTKAELDRMERAEHSSDAANALGRVEIPKDVRARINAMLTPGSSFAITNDGISKETTPKGTDFIVLMQ